MINPVKETMRWTLMAAMVAACSAAVIGSQATWAGSVLAREGKTFTGKVELKAGNQVVVTPADGVAVTVPLQDVVQLSMEDASTPDGPLDADAHLPAPWQQRDIGAVKEPGSGAQDKGVFSLQGAGWGIWGGQDSFHFVYQPMTGDGEVMARVVDLPTDETPFGVGLTIRNGLEPDSLEASIMLRAGGVPRVNCRPVQGTRIPSELKQQSWVRLFRAGERFGAFASRDGITWVPVGWVNVKMNATVYAGLACAATGNQKLVAAAFDHVTVRAQDAGPMEGLGLVDGTILAGRAKAFDGLLWRYTDPIGVEHTLPSKTVAYIFTRPLPADQRGGGLSGRKMGVSLLNGDAIEGQVNALRDGKFAVDSLVFGLQNPELTRVVTAVLRPVVAEGTFSVSTRDGTIYRCKEVTVEDGVVTAAGGSMGAVRVKAADLTRVLVEPTPGQDGTGKK